MLVGVGNFSGGVTLRDHVSQNDSAVMDTISGFDPADGTLQPENVVSKLSGTALPGTTPEQTPAVFVEGDSSILVVRDKDSKFRELSGGTWGAAGDAANIVKESLPVRLGDQIIFATDGADPILMAYEPASTTTKLRPLSFKSPSDYNTLTKPIVTPSASGLVQMFDCETNIWAALGTGCTIDNTPTNSAVLSFGHTTPVSTKCFTKSLGSTGVSLTGVRYLMLDAMVQNDPQPYTTLGMFINDAGMYQSGYELWLYDNTACTEGTNNVNVLARLEIPRLTPLSEVCRVVFFLGQLTGTVKGLAIWTTYNFVAPDTGKTWKMTLYSNATDDSLSTCGNWFCPAVAWDKQSFSDRFTKQIDYTAPVSGNLVSNGDFETIDDDAYGDPTLPHDWTLLNGASVSTGGRTADSCIIMDNYNTGSWTRKGVETTNWITVSPGEHYLASMYFIGPISYGGGGDYEFDFTVLFDDSTTKAVHWGRSSGIFGWTKLTLAITVPSAATSCKIIIQGANNNWGMAGFRVDDVELTLTDTKPSAGTSAIIWQVFDPAGTDRTPEDSLIEYAYCFCGRDTLSKSTYNLMISNPASIFTQVFANPWRSYSVAITLPTNSLSETAITEYGDYILTFLLYRRIYDGSSETWGDWTFWQSLPIAASATAIDAGVLDDDQDYSTAVNGYDVPEVMELTNDYASSALYAMVADNRVYAACLDWNETEGKWERKTAIEVSSLDKPWAFPTTIDDDSLSTDGSELDGYAVTGSEVRGLIARADDKFVFLDTEFFLLRGDTPKSGYRFVRIDSIGCISGRTIVDCRSVIIWHGPDFFYGYSGGLSTPISRFKIDSSLTDWTKPHNAVYSKDRYVCYCEYNDVPSLLIYDLTTQSWRIRSSASYNFVGIAVDGSTGAIYGVTPTGDAVDPFGSTISDYGATSTVRDVKTQYLVLSSPSEDVHVSRAVVEAVTSVPGGVTLSLTFLGRGAVNTTKTSSLTIIPGKFRYFVTLDMTCESISIETAYAGTAPPSIYYLGVEPDGVAVR